MLAHWNSALRRALCLAAVGVVAGCSVDTAGLAVPDAGPDAGPGMDAARPDGGARDAGDDAGAGDGCQDAPDGESCDDGVFCNGEDTCAGGSCSVHAGDPCRGETVCDEAAATCTGCLEDADCPEDIRGGWGACEGFADACAESGTQEREVTSFTCGAGTCDSSVSTEARSCTRSTDGDDCGSPSAGDWGACTNDGSPCAYDGVQERTVTQPVCAGGSCGGSTTRTETRDCTRDTDGDSCLDGNLCTSGETCSGGVCEPGTITTCDDDNPCTEDTCNPGTGACSSSPTDGTCNDGDLCRADRCVDGMCVSECDDGDPCTEDRCHPAPGMGCDNKPIMGCTSG